ncbi:hypothetical protein M9H77_20976 [Catharanthus roseus]|uniref:Uncharacterized protein n=1 Tax=Catharanthus roseus TaxID=4058 RepID=A0ACC0ANZ3_CATRO|nr:hypothetical protein M9H77_20976 [Catharanthus roseus]
MDRQESILGQRRGFHNLNNLTLRQTMREKDNSRHVNYGVRDDLSQTVKKVSNIWEPKVGEDLELEEEEIEAAWVGYPLEEKTMKENENGQKQSKNVKNGAVSSDKADLPHEDFLELKKENNLEQSIEGTSPFKGGANSITRDEQEIVELLQGPVTRAMPRRMEEEHRGKIAIFEKVIQDLAWQVIGEQRAFRGNMTLLFSKLQVKEAKGSSLEELDASKSKKKEGLDLNVGGRIHPTFYSKVLFAEENIAKDLLPTPLNTILNILNENLSEEPKALEMHWGLEIIKNGITTLVAISISGLLHPTTCGRSSALQLHFGQKPTLDGKLYTIGTRMLSTLPRMRMRKRISLSPWTYRIKVLKSSISYCEASSTTSSVMPVMMADVSSVEEQLANLTKLVEGLAKHCQQQNMTFAQLLN